MKKDYTKPVMEIVSFTTENVITESGGLTTESTNQKTFAVISY